MDNTLPQPSIEESVINNLTVISNFNFGHNQLRSVTALEQIFSQIYENLAKVLAKHKHTISDINIAEYLDGNVISNKVNICWYRFKEATDTRPAMYFVMLNPRFGVTYNRLTNDNISELLLNGQLNNGWHLLNQVDCLHELLSDSTTDDASIVNMFFDSVIRTVVKKIFEAHETDYSLRAHYTLQHVNELSKLNDIDELISTIQVKSTSNIIDSAGATYIHSNNDTIFTYTDTTTLHPITYDNDAITKIINSTYLLKRKDVSSFLVNLTKQKADDCNVRFFYAHILFSDLKSGTSLVEFVDSDYAITSQLLGKFKLSYADGTTIELPPTCQAVPIVKTPNELLFIVMLYSNNQLTKKIKKISTESVNLLYTLKGAINTKAAAITETYEQFIQQ